MNTCPRNLSDTAPGPFAARIALLIPALLLAPMLALAQPSGGAKSSARLASLDVEIWPEYDRAGAALIILKGELAKEVALPAAVSLRLPVASGGPNAVAYSRARGENLLNLAYERSDSPEAITIRFRAPERHFHVELYDPVATTLPARSYTYAWLGDLATEQMLLIVQEPAGASGLETQPKTELSETGQDALRYYSARLGPQAEGKRVPLTVRYTKTDLRTSLSIVRPKGDTGPAKPPALPDRAAGEPVPALVIVLLAVAALAIAGLVLFVLWQRRARSAPTLPHGACTNCGAPRREGDRFCGKCGAQLSQAGGG